jgi:hypothetical protein
MNRIERFCKYLLDLWGRWQFLSVVFPFIVILAVFLDIIYIGEDPEGLLMILLFPLGIFAFVLFRVLFMRYKLDKFDSALKEYSKNNRLNFFERTHPIWPPVEFSSKAEGNINGLEGTIHGYCMNESDELAVISFSLTAKLRMFLKYSPLIPRIISYLDSANSIPPYELNLLYSGISVNLPEKRAVSENAEFGKYLAYTDDINAFDNLMAQFPIKELNQHKAAIFLQGNVLYYILTRLPKTYEELDGHIRLAAEIATTINKKY